MPTTKPKPQGRDVTEDTSAPQSADRADRLVRDAFTFARDVAARKVLVGFDRVAQPEALTSDSAAEWPSFADIPLVASQR